jgi:hypothetical protein
VTKEQVRVKRIDQPAHQPTPTHNSSIPAWTDLTYADAVADCPTHRAQHEQAEARHAEFSAANGASVARRDRIQLSLQLAKRTAVTA